VLHPVKRLGGNGSIGMSKANNFLLCTVLVWKTDVEANIATTASEIKSPFHVISFLNYLSYK